MSFSLFFSICIFEEKLSLFQNSLMCHIKELVAALANALKLSLMTEIELYSHVSDEEFEIIRLSKRERRREILKLIKVRIFDVA